MYIMRIHLITENFLSATIFCSILICFIIIISWITRLRHKYFKTYRLIDDAHYWLAEDLISPVICNVCSSSIISGFCCSSCLIYVHERCVKPARRLYKCKMITTDDDEQPRHQWTKGNLDLNSVCVVCAKACGAEPRLCDYRCLWCQRIVHEYCIRALNEECDLGEFRQLIIPPNAVVSRAGNQRVVGYRHGVVEKILHPGIHGWTPLLIIGNRKSGGTNSDIVLNLFRTHLNAIQVIDVTEINPVTILNWCNSLPETEFRILIIGGDGTVSWILETIENNITSIKPAMGILPMGTGNDLARILGWGSGEDATVDAVDYLRRLVFARVSTIDRWSVNINSKAKHFGLPTTTPRKLRMSNYFSVGCDALVALNFHKRRDTIPEFLASRFLNKLYYFHYGTIDTFLKECKDLQDNTRLELDGVEVTNLPNLEGICILNIPSWGAGVRVWGAGPNIPVQRINDGRIEVFGIYSSFHIAQMQVGLADPFRIGQAQHVKLTLNKRFPVQCDGEPWEQSPCVVEISHFGQAKMLVNGLDQ